MLNNFTIDLILNLQGKGIPTCVINLYANIYLMLSHKN